MGVDDAMRRLHHGSLKAFVTRRKSLAKELRDAGDEDGARSVAAVGKPTLGAWVANQLIFERSDLVEAVLVAIDRQRDLQLGALSGALDAEALTAAKHAEKAALADVVVAASALLRDDGHAISKGNLERVKKALRSAALDPDARAMLMRGGLLRDEAEGGFEAVASQLDPAMLLAALSAKSSKRAPQKRRVDGMFARSTRSDGGRAPRGPGAEPTAAAAVAHGADRAEREAAEQRERLAAAQAAAARARSQIAEQRAAVARHEERVVDLERQLTAARAEARRARRQLGDYKVKLEQVEKRIRILDE